MPEPDPIADPAAFAGAMIGGGFGIAWALWGASGLPGGPAIAVRVAATAIGVLIVLGGARLQRWARPGGRAKAGAAPGGTEGSLFSSPAYRLVVALEVIALFGGGALLGATGHSEYTIAWFAGVVGVHFLAFGRLFWAGFYWLGAALLSAGVAGFAVGLAGGGPASVRAVSGLTAAASLFTAGGWPIATTPTRAPR
jgi:hypothetical protein